MDGLMILTLEERKQIVSEVLLFLGENNIRNEEKERSLQDTIDGLDNVLQKRIKRIIIEFLLTRNDPIVEKDNINEILKEVIKENNKRSIQGIV